MSLIDVDPEEDREYLERRVAELNAQETRAVRWYVEGDCIVCDDREERWRHIVPRHFHAATVDDLTGDVADAVTRWRQAPSNMLLLGNVGTGKTHTAIAAARLAHDAGHRVRFWPVVELLDALRPGGDCDALDQAVEADVLVLDDLGQEKATDWAGERLYLLVNRRWMDGAPIIATSNLAAANGKGPLVDAVGQRVYSRLVHNAVTLRIGGRDRRRPS